MRAIIIGLLCFFGLGDGSPAHAQDTSVYKVSNLAVDVSAKDAVTAKNQALAMARSQALYTVMRRVAPFNSSGKFPIVKDAVIEDMLEGYSVLQEKNSRTRYLATLEFRFNSADIRQILSGVELGIADEQAETTTVLPVFINKGAIDHSGRDPWRRAWIGQDLKNALTPVKLGRVGPSFKLDQLSALIGGDTARFIELRDKLKAEKLVLAIAEPTADGQTLTHKMFGVDQVGSFSLSRHEPVQKSDLKSSAMEAARTSLGILEGRWKLVQAPGGGAGPDGAVSAIEVVVEFSGMGEWKDIRSRLVKVPGLVGLDVKSLSARTAQVAFKYPGGAERLSSALVSQGMSLHGGNGAWVVRSN